MEDAGWHRAVRISAVGSLPAALVVLATVASALVVAPPAQAGPGYELNASNPSHSLGGSKVAHGIAVDQASQRIYLAITTANSNLGTPGNVEWLNSDLTPAGTFGAGTESYYAGVAVNPVTQEFYAAQSLLHGPTGALGQSKMQVLSSSGVLGTSFVLSDTETLPQIATDSTGDVYYPNAATDSIQVFNSAGVLQEQIVCTGCPGGSFGRPVSVALNSEDDLYVADLAPDRVIKLTSSGGPYTFASVLQSGRGAAAVAVDPSSDAVLVGDMLGGKNYHIAAYDSSGTQFDDFGAGLFSEPPAEIGALAAAQIGVNATTHRLYVGDLGKFYIFDRVATISPPTVTIEPANPVGQLTATVHSAANVKGHTALECKFEYTDDADFQVNSFASATSQSCSTAPAGTGKAEIETSISGLTPVTVYHYRTTVATYAGSVTSTGTMFETLPVVPSTVTPESPLGVTQVAATLRGKVNPHGGTVSSCRFEYGTSVSYGTNISCSKLPEPVTTDVPQSRSISGLSPGTTYHYRLMVTSNAGTVKGGDVEFTTASPPAPPVPPTPPPTTPPVTTVPPPTTPPTTTPPPLRCKKGFQKKRVRGKLKCVKKKRHAPRRRTHK